MSTLLISQFTSHPWMTAFLVLGMLPVLALWLLRNRLQPGKVPQENSGLFVQLETEASQALRRVVRERSSLTVREEARRKLLQLQSRIRYSEAPVRRSHENELSRLLTEAARHGITVTPDESMSLVV